MKGEKQQKKYKDKVTGLAKHLRATEYNIIGHQLGRARVHLASSGSSRVGKEYKSSAGTFPSEICFLKCSEVC